MATNNAVRGRVIVGFDGSPAAARAVRWASEEAVHRGCELVLVGAVEPPVMAGSIGMGLPAGQDLVDALTAQVAETLSQAAAGLPDARCVVEVGAASGVLLEQAEAVDVLVVGSRGRGGFTGLLLGSVSSQVAPHARCPVVVVRDEPRAGAHAVVVGVDGSASGQAALAFAFDEASRRGWHVRAVHAWEVPAYDLIAVPQVPQPISLVDAADDEIRLASEALAGFRERYPDVEVSEHVVRGPAVAALLEASADAALVVVGTTGHGPALGALLGSVSHALLHKAHLPVAVVPAPRAMERAA